MQCYITDRRTLPVNIDLLDCIARNLAAGVEWVQVREKDLSARELFDLTARVLALPNPHRSKILVNTRVDVAIAAGQIALTRTVEPISTAMLRVNPTSAALLVA